MASQGVSMNEERKPSGSSPVAGTGRISSRLIHDGRVVHLSMDRVRFPDGKEGELELIRHRGAAAVVPLLGDPGDPDPEVVMVHQYRYAAGGMVYEIPAGLPRDGEGWESCARRELEEETGYRGRDFTHLTRFFTTPGFTNEVIQLYAATGLTGGRTSRDEDEYIEVVHFPFSEIRRMIREGEIADGKTMVGLLFVDRYLREGG